MRVRVLRIMEYTYKDEANMIRDMRLWKVQGTMVPGSFLTIKEVTLPPELLSDADEPVPETKLEPSSTRWKDERGIGTAL